MVLKMEGKRLTAHTAAADHAEDLQHVCLHQQRGGGRGHWGRSLSLSVKVSDNLDMRIGGVLQLCL